MGNCFSAGIEKKTATTETKAIVGRTNGGRVLAEAKTEKNLSAKEAAARAADVSLLSLRGILRQTIVCNHVYTFTNSFIV